VLNICLYLTSEINNMRKTLLGFIAIGLFVFVGCKKDNESSNQLTSNDKPIDADGNVYKSVIIGEQEWMAENLRTTKYSDGTVIPNVESNTQWENLHTGAWSQYENDSQYDSIYGKLYNFYAVNKGNLCPTGWHVPSDEEWIELTDFLATNGHSGSEALALKSTSGWIDDGNGTDDYGWNGLPGGYRDIEGPFSDVGESGNWWSSSQEDGFNAWYRGLYNYDDKVDIYGCVKQYGFSVRCVRD